MGGGWRRSRSRSRCLLAAGTLLLSASTLRAQSGGLFLLVPFGARAVAQGEAVVADSSVGTEGIWWNAAALARQGKREAAVHHGQTVIATSDMIAYAVPSRVLGTLAASAFIMNYGDQQATDAATGTPIGTITNRNYLLALSYATPVGKRLSAGITYKFLMLRFQCSGICGEVPVISGSSHALDAGVQYHVPAAIPITVGASLRNLGPPLQVKDAEQADPLPRIAQLGIRTRVPVAALARSAATLDLAADLLSASALGGAAAGIGATLGYRDVAFLRAGYKMQPGQGRGPSIGFGFERGALAVDFARRFDALSSQIGEPPTYVGLRARF